MNWSGFMLKKNLVLFQRMIFFLLFLGEFNAQLIMIFWEEKKIVSTGIYEFLALEFNFINMHFCSKEMNSSHKIEQ